MSDPTFRPHFDRFAASRDALFASQPVMGYEQEARANALREMLDLLPGERVLDIGCGTGRDLRAVHEAGCRAAAIDFSESMVREARQLLGPLASMAHVADATRLPFADETFDKVYASEVIEHVPGYQRVIAEMIRVLKPGGALVITTPNRQSWYGIERFWIVQGLLGRKWNHVCDEWKTAAEVRRVFEQSGADVVGTWGICFIPGFIISYRLPVFLQRALVRVTRILERPLRRLLSSNGYMIGMKGIKRRR